MMRGPPGSTRHHPLFPDTTLLRSGNRVLRNHSPEGTTTYAYDGSDRLLSSTTGGAQIAYGYDANGNRISETGPDGTTLFGWSSLGQLVSQVDTPAGASATVTRHTYGPTGLRIATDSGGDHQTFTERKSTSLKHSNNSASRMT